MLVTDDEKNVLLDNQEIFPLNSPKKKISLKIKLLITLCILLLLGIVVTVGSMLINKRTNEQKVELFMSALELMEKGQHKEAEEVFAGLGEFNNAQYFAEECAAVDKYKKASELMAAEKYVEAQQIFNEISDYENSKDLGKECQDKIDYSEADKQIAEEKFAEALETLKGLDQEVFPDIGRKLKDCYNGLRYREAIELIERKKLSEAFEKLVSLGKYRDSEKLITECSVAIPLTSELYHNPSYVSTAVALKIIAPQDKTMSYLKIMSKDKQHVATIFIRPKEQIQIHLPVGDYSIKSAFGEHWFGEAELFGDKGGYEVLLPEYGLGSFLLSKDESYILSLRAGADGGITVNSRNEIRTKF